MDAAERYIRAQATRDALVAHRQHDRHRARGDAGEQVVRDVLAPLAEQGWHLWHNRRRPGRVVANVDHLLVGPGGVVVVDAKSWTGVDRTSGDRLLCSDVERGEELAKLRRQVDPVEQALASTGLAQLEIVGRWCWWVGRSAYDGSVGFTWSTIGP